MKDSKVTPLVLLVMEALLLVAGEKALRAVFRIVGTSNMEGAAPRVEMESSSWGIPSLIGCSEGRISVVEGDGLEGRLISKPRRSASAASVEQSLSTTIIFAGSNCREAQRSIVSEEKCLVKSMSE